MSTIAVADYPDLVLGTLSRFKRLKVTDLTSDYQNTYFVKRVIKAGKTDTEDGGKDITFFLTTDHNNSARFTGLAYVTTVDITNSLISGTIPWKITVYNWAWEYIALQMNSPNGEKLVDLLTLERNRAAASYILRMESAGWRAPAVTDTTSIFGIPYYIVKSATANTTNSGFNGLVPSGFTTVAGINPTTEPRWRNYAGPYTAITHDDLIRKIRHAMDMTYFEPLVEDEQFRDVGNDKAMYTNRDTWATMAELAESQNDDLGPDLASMDGKMVVRRTPLAWVKELGADTTNPIYGTNWRTLRWVKMRDQWMKETTFKQVPNQPSCGYTDVRCVGNLICYDRRSNWVLSNGTTMPA